MRKADAALIERLASSDEAERVGAALALDSLASYYFEGHHVDHVRPGHPWIDGLVAAWRTSDSERVRVWAAQLLVLARAPGTDAAEAVASLADADGDYASEVALYLCRSQGWLSNGLEIVRRLAHHRNPFVRQQVALQFSTTWRGVSYDEDMGMLRALMRDRSALPRLHAVNAACRFDAFGQNEDIDALLHVVAIDAGAARNSATHVLAELGRKLGRDFPDASVYTPVPSTHGVYIGERHELDPEGRWVSAECFRFMDDGTVVVYQGDEGRRTLGMLLQASPAEFGRGAVHRSDAEISFSINTRWGPVTYSGTVDGDRLSVSRLNMASGRAEACEFTHWSIDWERDPSAEQQVRLGKYQVAERMRLSGLAKKGIPFPTPRPRSMTAAIAAKWYMQMSARLPGLIRDAGNEGAGLALAWKLKHLMRDYAVAALYDPGLKKRFVQAFDLPTLDELSAWTRLHQPEAPVELAALDRLLTFTEAQQHAFPSTIDEAIGLQYWDGDQTWEMTDSGWVASSRPS